MLIQSQLCIYASSFAVRLVSIPHPIQSGEYLRGLAPPRRPAAAAEVPAEVLVGVGCAVAGAVRGLHGVEGLEDFLLRHAVYVAADGGDARRLARQVAHHGEHGGCSVLALLAEDIRALLAHKDHRPGKRPEDRYGVVGVAAE